MKLKAYKSLFNNLYYAAVGTAVCQFVVFLLTFLLLCYASTFIKIPIDSKQKEEIFIAKFEKYLIFTAAILILIPYLLSLILTFGVIHKHYKLLDLWIKALVGFAPFYTLGLIATGIFLSVEGSYIGYVAIVIALFLGGLMVHSILLINCLYDDYKEDAASEDGQSVKSNYNA